jgi:hypothetical protein
LLICLGGFSAKAFPADEPLGLIESYEKLSDIHKTKFQDSEKLIASNIQVLSVVSNLKDFQVEPLFVRSLLLSSEDKYLALIQNDECKFFSLLENNLLKTASGDVKSISITFKNKEGEVQSAAIPPQDFFLELYKKKCFNNKEFSTLFNNTNIKKTIEGIRFTVPKNKQSCATVHNEWLLNSYTPYLCQIQKTMTGVTNSNSEFYRQNLSAFHRTYLENLCSHLNSAELFCENYLKEDIWNKVINGEAPLYKMGYKCKHFFSESETLGHSELAACATKLLANPQVCETKGTKDFPSIFPLQNCNQISKALDKSKLVTDYQDCPGNIANEMLTNIHRIVKHFDSSKILSTKDQCASETDYTIAKLNLDVKNESRWPLKICFLNRIRNKEECTSYVPGTHDKEDRSEDVVVAKILYHQKGAPRKTTCQFVDSKNYNPLLSAYKQGCFIVYDRESCTNLACHKKVIWDEKEQIDIKYKGRLVFDYFPTNYLSERFSLTSLVNEVKGTQSRGIKNLTDMLFYLDKIPGSIIHGVGCAEDLLPEFFPRNSINGCHPLPFIVDGHIEKDNTSLLVFRSAIDDIHTPRLILWQNIFNAVSAYQLLHPLNTWTLYGIKK